jgi:nickel/cobalt transporter (NicO) family protein
MIQTSELLLVGTVAVVGVLHTIVPDHWVPITLIARQRGWSQTETAIASLKAGIGHVLSTLAIALVIWLAGVAVATRFGHWVDTIASLALIGFGSWIAISAWRDVHSGQEHGHVHDHGHAHASSHPEGSSPVHGPEVQRIDTEHGVVDLSIFETGGPPHFRLTGNFGDTAVLETQRDNGSRQIFVFRNRGRYWESAEEIPEPHEFQVTLTMDHEGHAHTYIVHFAEHEHAHEEPVGGQTPPKTTNRTALLLILGSSPMVEGIPAFFAASKYGVGLIILMSLVFGATTIITYVVLCVYSTAALRRVTFGPFERYGEVLSGAFIALIGLVFWIWPVL